MLVGGFGLCGNPLASIEYLSGQSHLKDLTVVSNDCGTNDQGLRKMVQNNQVARVVGSFMGENKLLQSLYL